MVLKSNIQNPNYQIFILFLYSLNYNFIDQKLLCNMYNT